MRPFLRLSAILVVLLAPQLPARTFTVVAYNVENLFDLDGVSGYEDYQSARYTPAHALTKLRNIAGVVAKFDGGRGPDVLLLSEIEVDATPGAAAPDYDAILARLRGKTLDQLLAAKTLDPAVADLPAEALLLKALADAGITGYRVITGENVTAPGSERRQEIRCAVLTRLPVRNVRSHATLNARAILEVQTDVDGAPLYLFANHWKSGASDPESEPVRVANARTLRTRLDEILSSDPNADIIIGGDLNSQYNQRQRYPRMKETGINDVLGSQGNELAVRQPGRPLYNLWFELPAEQRGSDTYRGEWGTLMHLIISQGLADGQGLDYVPGSFGAVILPGLNAHPYPATPWRWTNYAAGAGISDHFPLKAEFTVHAKATTAPLTRPELSPSEGLPAFPTALDVSKFGNAKSIPALSPDEIAQQVGKVFVLEGIYNGGTKPTLMIGDKRYALYVPNQALLKSVKATEKGQAVRWLGQLNFYKGQLEFMISSPDWLKAR
jgi:endonuclease/exonuclease/phosphatase family metal-dependent hydrolase